MRYGESGVWHVRSTDTVDGDGNDVEQFADVPVTDLVFIPAGSTVDDRGRSQVTTEDRVVVLRDWAAKAQDELTVRGVRRTISGTPRRFQSPYTGRRVTEIDLEEVTG